MGQIYLICFKLEPINKSVPLLALFIAHGALSMTFLHRRLSPSLIVASWLLAGAAPAALAACSVTTPPEGWAASALRWDGDCANGVATGLGVLKELQGAAVQRSFFGRVDNGELLLGV